MSVRRLISIIAIGCFALIASVILLVLILDLNSFRPRIAATLSNALGREVTIEGEVSAGFALVPEVVARGIRIANPDWASRDYFAYTERVEIQFELIPLLQDGLLIVSELKFVGGDVLLERRADGSNNWTFGNDQSDTTDATPTPLPQIDRLTIEDSVVALLTPDEPEQRLELVDLTVNRNGFLDIDLEAHGTFRDWPFELEAAGGPPTDPTVPGPWPFATELDLAGLRMMLDGAFEQAFEISGLAFDVEVLGGAIGWIERTFDLAPIDRHYALTASVEFSEQGLTVSNLRGDVENLDFVESLSFTDGAFALQGQSARITARGFADGQPFDIVVAAPQFQSDGAPMEVSLAAEVRSTSLGGTGSIGWQDGELVLDVGVELATPRLDDLSDLVNVALPAWGPFASAARLRVDGEQLSLLDLSAQLGTSEFSGELTVDTSKQRPQVTGFLHAPLLNVADFDSDRSSAEGSSSDYLDAPLSVEWMQQLDLQLNLTVDEVVGTPGILRNVAISTELADGRLTLDPFSFSIAAVALRGRGSLVGGVEPAVELAIRAERLAPEETLQALDLPETIRGAVRDLQLEFASSGRSLNLILDRAGVELSTGTGELDIDLGLDDGLFDASIDSIAVIARRDEPVRLVLSGTAQSTPFDLTLSGGRLRDLLRDIDAWPTLGFSVNTRLADQSVSITGELSPFSHLFDGGELTLNATGEMAGFQGVATGVLPSLSEILDASLEVGLRSQDPTAFLALLNLEQVAPRPIEAGGTLSFADDVLNVAGLVARLGANEVRGELALTLAPRPAIATQLETDWLNLDAVLEELPAAAGEPDRAQSFFSAQPLQLDWLDTFNLHAGLDVATLQFRGLSFVDVANRTQIQDGTLTSDLSSDDGAISAKIELENGGLAPTVTAALQVREYRPQATLDSSAQETEAGSLAPAVSADISLTGRGDSIATMLGSANGEVKLWAGAGRFGLVSQGFLMRNLFGEILRVVNPLSQDPGEDELACAALYLQVEDGIASATQGIAIQTTQLNLLGSGAINLQTEELDVRLRIQQRRGFGISLAGIANQFVKLGGSLSNPRVQLNPTSALAAGGAAWATGGLSLLYTGLYQRVFATRRPCEQVLPELASQG